MFTNTYNTSLKATHLIPSSISCFLEESKHSCSRYLAHIRKAHVSITPCVKHAEQNELLLDTKKSINSTNNFAIFNAKENSSTRFYETAEQYA